MYRLALDQGRLMTPLVLQHPRNPPQQHYQRAPATGFWPLRHWGRICAKNSGQRASEQVVLEKVRDEECEHKRLERRRRVAADGAESQAGEAEGKGGADTEMRNAAPRLSLFTDPRLAQTRISRRCSSCFAPRSPGRTHQSQQGARAEGPPPRGARSASTERVLWGDENVSSVLEEEEEEEANEVLELPDTVP